jgi:hypothetical protein
MGSTETALHEIRVGDLTIAHRADLAPALVVQAIARHRENAARRSEGCEHWGEASSVSRVVVGDGEGFDLAVKWNHWRGPRGALSDRFYGSRARKAVAGADRLAAIGLDGPETLAIAERRRFGFVTESFLLTRFLADALPLPAAMPEIRRDPRRRRRLATRLGEAVGTLHAAGADHSDLKHSNLLVTADDRYVFLDLDTLVPPRAPSWRRRVRALGQLEAYAVDLYPWLPRTDRLRFLRAYLGHNPELAPRRRELVEAVRQWVERRIASWAKKDRSTHVHFPLAPRAGGDA